MIVIIIEKATGKVVAEVETNFGAMNFKAKQDDFNDLAWDSAVEDHLVDPNHREKYSFQMQED